MGGQRLPGLRGQSVDAGGEPFDVLAALGVARVRAQPDVPAEDQRRPPAGGVAAAAGGLVGPAGRAAGVVGGGEVAAHERLTWG
jgi:hypothetical protein